MTVKATMKSFTEEIVSALRDLIPDAEIQVQEISKPGECHLTSICIRSNNANVAPIIYLNEVYQQYLDGMPIDHIADQLQQVYLQNCLANNFDTSLITDWLRVSDRVCARLINLPNNAAYLEGKVTRPIQSTDIGYMYYIDLADFTKPGASVPVTESLFSAWNISLEALHETALANTENIMQPSVRPMGAVMQEMLDAEDGITLAESPSMYVITSQRMLNGAIIATLPNVCSELQQHLGNYALLPSSIHEMLAVPANLQTPDALLAMVAEIIIRR